LPGKPTSAQFADWKERPMKPNNKRQILAVVDDLFFATKIGETAKRAGVNVAFATTEEAVLQFAAQRPSLIIVDLNLNAAKPLPLIAKLKNHPDLKGTSILAFVSHVQGELKQKAQKAGCDMVLARSSFSQNLPQILKRHAE
jgi:CheY-like chemotaxis protein